QQLRSNYYQSFEHLSRKHRAAMQSEKLLAWAAKQLDAAKDENVRANLYWILGDRRAAAASLAKATPSHELAQWKDRFRTAGNDDFRELLKALIAAHPEDTQSQLELLELDGVTDGPQLVVRLELLLESDSQWAFGRGKGATNQTQFKDRFELAYRLIRMYERAGQFDKLHTLGLRIARGEKPFKLADFSQFQYRDSNGVPERGNAAIAVAIQYADTDGKIASLKAALENSVWAGARAQLQRRVAKDNPKPTVELGWANLPAGLQLIASTENVLALTHDDLYVYSGHPWGVAVHDHDGQPVTRIALGEAARSMVVMQQHLWVGSPKGLFRINRTDWSVAHQWLHEDVESNDRYGKSFPGTKDYWFDNSVYTLTADDDDLWIGLHRNVQRLNTRTLELRAWSFEELKIDSWAGFSNIVVDGRYVWANSDHAGVRRYDRDSDEWSAPGRVGPREPVRFVGIIEGRVFGNTYVDDQLRNRLCLIDRETLATQTIQIAVKKEHELINNPLRFYGKYGDRLVFGVDWPAFVLDEATLTLLPIAKVVENFSEQLQIQRAARNGNASLAGAIRAVDQLDAFRETFGRPYPGKWQVLTLPDGTRVLGTRQNRIRYEYPHEDSRDSMASAQHEVTEIQGGLFFVKPDEADIRRVSAEPRSSSIRGDVVRAIVFGTEHSWLCTTLGIAQFDLQRGIERIFTRADGLCSNRVTGAAEASGKTYFSTSWGDSGGGLAVLDSTTSVFTTLMEEDGLPTGKLESVQVDGRQLRLVFGTEYLRHNSSENLRYRRFPPLAFDPETNQFGQKVEPKLLAQNEAEPREIAKGSTVPFLAGALTQRVEHEGKVYLCGTRGLVISDGEVSDPTFPEIGVRRHITLAARHLAEANARKVEIQSAAELAVALRDENLYYRANAIASTIRIQQTA
ncbi:MAG: hypothetical protein O3B86_19775, partial [Planctomycetota bacterium]|nr:hypothetical protein [Planctomycetota bacterium]